MFSFVYPVKPGELTRLYSAIVRDFLTPVEANLCLVPVDLVRSVNCASEAVLFPSLACFWLRVCFDLIFFVHI